MKLLLPLLALATLAACGSSSRPADEPTREPVAALDAAPAGDPRELVCTQRLERFGEGSTEALAGCVAGFADREEVAACHAAGKSADYASCYEFCLGSVGIDPDPAVRGRRSVARGRRELRRGLLADGVPAGVSRSTAIWAEPGRSSPRRRRS